MNELVKYQAGGKDIELSPQTVKNYLIAGNGAVSDQEIVMFIELCKYRQLNPYLREAYLIKYGDSPATIIVGKDAVLKKALSNKTYAGHEAGIVVYDEKLRKVDHRNGSMMWPGDKLIGGWCKVRKNTVGGLVESMYEVSFDEYALRDAQGNLKSNWKVKPATMIRKVALVQGLRESFPEDLDGMYEAEEMHIDEKALPVAPVETKVIDVTPPEREPEPVVPEPVARIPEQQTAQPVREPLNSAQFTITFGKHKGRTLEYIDKTDPGYVIWIAEKSDNEQANRAANAYLNAKQLVLDAIPSDNSDMPFDLG